MHTAAFLIKCKAVYKYNKTTQTWQDVNQPNNNRNVSNQDLKAIEYNKKIEKNLWFFNSTTERTSYNVFSKWSAS